MRSIKSLTHCIPVLILIPFLFSNCAGLVKRESPVVRGWGIYTMPGWALNSGTELHATLGYSRFNFGGGHNNFLQAGPQVRWSLAKGKETGFWVGGEATYVNVSVKYDNSSTKPKGSGFTIGPAAGYNFQLGKVPLNVYFVPAYLHRGDLKANGQTNIFASNGFLGRIGIDLEFMRLINKK